MEFKNVSFEQEGRVAVLTVNRPEKRNVLNKSTRLEISTALERVEREPGIGVLVVTGAGDKAFIAGSDLNEFGRMPPWRPMSS